MIYSAAQPLALGPTTLLLEPAAAAAAMTWLPSSMFIGWQEDGTNITLPLAGMETYGLSAALADATTGDARQVALSLASRMFAWYNDLATKPGAMLCEMRRRAIPTAGSFIGKEPIEFKFTFYTSYPSSSIADEE